MIEDRSGGELVDSVRGWLVFFALGTVGTVLIMLANAGEDRSRTAIAVLIVVLTQVVYFVSARPAVAGIRTDRPRAWVFAAMAIVGFGPAVFFNPWATAALFALTPEVFLLFTFRWAAGVIVALNAAAALGQLLLGSFAVRDIVERIGIAVFIVTFSVFFGSRLVAIAERSGERLRLIGQLREREAEVVALSAARGAEAERTRIARDMHDTLAQGFTSIVTLGHAVLAEIDADHDAARRHVELITQTAGENLAESRRIIQALSPARLDGASLHDAVQRIVTGFAEETGISARLALEGVGHASAPQAEVVALRVVQECLANARKHSAAQAVDVRLTYTDQLLEVVVHDDGAGFDAAAPTPGFGLAGMRARVGDVGGDLTVTSAPAAGTTVAARIPLAVTA